MPIEKFSLPSLRAVKPIFNDLEQSAMYNALLLHLLCDVLMMKLGIMTLNGVLWRKKTRDGIGNTRWVLGRRRPRRLRYHERHLTVAHSKQCKKEKEKRINERKREKRKETEEGKQ